MNELKNPYAPPVEVDEKYAHHFSKPAGFWRRLMEAFWPHLRCKRIDHTWEYSDFIWIKKCRDCRKLEQVRT